VWAEAAVWPDEADRVEELEAEGLVPADRTEPGMEDEELSMLETESLETDSSEDDSSEGNSSGGGEERVTRPNVLAPSVCCAGLFAGLGLLASGLALVSLAVSVLESDSGCDCDCDWPLVEASDEASSCPSTMEGSMPMLLSKSRLRRCLILPPSCMSLLALSMGQSPPEPFSHICRRRSSSLRCASVAVVASVPPPSASSCSL